MNITLALLVRYPSAFLSGHFLVVVICCLSVIRLFCQFCTAIQLLEANMNYTLSVRQYLSVYLLGHYLVVYVGDKF